MTSDLISTFAEAPFFLDEAALSWVESTFSKLENPRKASILFSQLTFGPALEADALEEHQPGFITRIQPGAPDAELAQQQALNARFDVPVLYCADLEGSTTSLPGGMPSPNPLSFGAANDAELTERANYAMGMEARQYGIGWSYTPAIDLNLAFRSAITGTRSFGSDKAAVQAHGLGALRGLQAAGLAATAKHWPGEATDSRDQHLVTTINEMTMPEWRASFGEMYQAAIDAGVKVIMSAHIAFPAYMREVVGETGADAYLPGSLNPHLNEGLLRGDLGFQGLIASDATPMAGISGLRRRPALVVDALNAGCDVLLGSVDLADDVSYILAALDDGRLSQERLDTAVLRQLALKASVGAHLGAAVTAPAPVDPAPVRAVLEKAPTLVHARKGLLPITPPRYRKVYVVSRGVGFPPASPTEPLPLAFNAMMDEVGFEVVSHVWGTPVDPSGCDLLLYVYAEECLLTRGTITNEWGAMNGDFVNAMARQWHDIPTLMISFGWPYHLYEAPGVWGYVNAYMAHPATQKIVLEALMGLRSFEGQSPVDPYCGLDERYFALFENAARPCPA